MRPIRSDPCFVFHKWTLITINFLVLIVSLIVAFLAISTIQFNNFSNSTYIQHNLPVTKEERLALEVFIIIGVFVANIITFIGLYGAIKEHRCTTLTFSFISLLSAIASIYSAITFRSYYWSSAVFEIFCALLALSFYRMLGRNYDDSVRLVPQEIMPRRRSGLYNYQLNKNSSVYGATIQGGSDHREASYYESQLKLKGLKQ